MFLQGSTGFVQGSTRFCQVLQGSTRFGEAKDMNPVEPKNEPCRTQ